MTDLPTWYPGSETKPAPMPLLLVQGFINTRDVEEDADLLADPPGARRWLLETGLLDEKAPLSESDVALAREVREGIRALADRPEDHDALEPLRAVAAAQRARLAVGDDGALRLENAGRGQVGDAMFELMLIVHNAQEDGSWERLKVCANPACRWAYFDRSRNQQGHWCNMASCGNRLKNRELRARRR